MTPEPHPRQERVGALTAEPSEGGAVPLRRLCVFCGASPGVSPRHIQLAARVGTQCARRGIAVVYGAGGVGVMGALSDAVLAESGTITGVITRSLMDREFGRRDLSDLRLVDTLHERKALMQTLSEAFLVLPGGYGTLEELFEVTAWAQLGLHHKPIVLLDEDGFFTPLSRMVDHAWEQGFLSDTDRVLVQRAQSVEAALRMAGAAPVPRADSVPTT